MAMGRLIYVDTGWSTISVPGTGSAAFDVLEVKLQSTQFAFLHKAKLLQHSEEQSTEAEEIRCTVKRASGAYTSGSGGAAATVTKGGTGDAAHNLAVATKLNTVIATGGTIEDVDPGVFQILNGEWESLWIPEDRPAFGPSEGIILGVGEAFADTITFRGFLTIELFGT